MGLYDNYKQSNSQYISQYVGNLVPELADFSQALKKRYNDARDTDDAIAEAMGNLQHLDTEEDTTYANELKQKYINRLDERSQREDYENMGRRTQRDARAFSSDYVPLVNRMKGMQAIQERVLQDDKIFDPNKKQQILGHIKRLNAAEKDASTGDFIRDAAGRVKLGSIQDWAYAKDVDINKKLAEFIKMKEADMNQSGYSPDGKGLVISHKRETRTEEDIAVMAQEMMKTDPEIRAMVNRDVTLATSGMSATDFSEQANEMNVSYYDKLKRKATPEEIKVFLKSQGKTEEWAKQRPLDAIRKQYEAQGKDVAQADEDFVKDNIRNRITDPHIDLVANLLKVDRRTIEARSDVVMAARIQASAMASLGAAILEDRNRSESIPVISEGTEAQKIDIGNIINESNQNEAARKEVESELQGILGNLAGAPPPGLNKKQLQDYYNNTSSLLNSTDRQAALLKSLPQRDAQNLQIALQKYQTMNNRSAQSAIILSQVRKEFENSPEGKELTKKGGFSFSSMFSTGAGLDKLFGLDAASRYKAGLQATADRMSAGKSFVESFTTIAPVTGKIVKQSEELTNGILNGQYKARGLTSGKDFNDIVFDHYGDKPWYWWDNKDKQIANQGSNMNEAKQNVKFTFNMQRSANGKLTATAHMGNGKTEIVEIDNIPASYGDGINGEFVANAAKMTSRGQAQHWMESAFVASGISAVSGRTNVAQLNNASPGSVINLTDKLAVKIKATGYKNDSKAYTIMVRDPRTGELVNSGLRDLPDVNSVLGLVGKQVRKNDWPADGPGVNNPHK